MIHLTQMEYDNTKATRSHQIIFVILLHFLYYVVSLIITDNPETFGPHVRASLVQTSLAVPK